MEFKRRKKSELSLLYSTKQLLAACPLPRAPPTAICAALKRPGWALPVPSCGDVELLSLRGDENFIHEQHHAFGILKAVFW